MTKKGSIQANIKLSATELKLLELISNPSVICDKQGHILATNSLFNSELLKGAPISEVSVSELLDIVSFRKFVEFANSNDTIEIFVIEQAEISDTQSFTYHGRLTCVREKNFFIVRFEFSAQAPSSILNNKDVEDFTDLLLEAIPASAYFKNTAHIYTACNEEFLKFYNRTRAEIIGRSAHDMVSKELADGFQKSDNAILSSGETQVQESNQEDAVGNIKNVVIQKTAVRNKQNEIIGLIGIVLDITERRQIEKELEQSQTIFNAIVEHSPAHIFVKDPEGRHTIASNKLHRNFNWEPGYMIGKTDYELFSQEIAEEYNATDELVKKSTQPLTLRDERLINGELRNYLTVKFSLRDKEGKFFGITGIATDITELVAAENTLKLAATDLEEQVRQRSSQIIAEIKDRETAERDIYEILSISPISVGMTNLKDNTIVLENQSLIDLFAPDSGTLIGVDSRELWVDLNTLNQIRAELSTTQKYKLTEVQLKKRSGASFPAKVYGRYMERDGIPYSVFWVVDLTEEKAAQEKIIASENSMREMLAASPVALGISDIKTGQISFINESFARLLKMPTDNILGSTTLQFWRNPEDRKAFVEELERTGKVKPREMEIRRLNGDIVWVLNSWTTILIEGTPKIVFWLNDISQIKEAEKVLKASHETLELHVQQRTEELRGEIEERQKIEEALRKSEQQFEAFASSASDWFWGTDENHIFDHLSERFEEITGLRSVDFYGKSRWDVIVSNADEDVWREHQQVILNHQPFRDLLYKIKREDGSEFHASVNGVPIFDHKGAFRGYRGAARDITQIVQSAEQTKQMEEQLHQAQKMEAIGQLTGGIAHDFNNILAVILGNVEIAQEKIENNLPVDKHLKVVENSAIKGATLTERLLAYSRKQELRPTSFHLNDLTTGVLTLVERLLGEAITIETDFNDNTSPVFADVNQLENALMNLCINSRDAMPDGGTLRISTGILDLTEDNTAYPELKLGLYSWLEVKDTGKGMDESTLTHSFEPFFTTKDVGKGTGLGLSMVYGFAHQSNGTVILESTPNAGTTARIILPSDVTR